jgi:Integrase core domain
MPRVNAIMERAVRTCRHELFNRTLIWNRAHLSHALREFEIHDNQHRPHRTLRQAEIFGRRRAAVARLCDDMIG